MGALRGRLKLLLPIVVLAALVLLAQHSPEHDHAGPHAPSPEESVPAAGDTPIPPEPTGPDEAEPSRAVEEDPDDARVLRGTVMLVEDSGEKRRAASGQLRVRVKERNRYFANTVSIDEGGWAIELDEGEETIEIQMVELTGRPCILLSPGRLRVPADLRIEVRVRPQEHTVLHVVEAESGVELQDVTVLRVDSYIRDDQEHPGVLRPKEVVLAKRQSPVKLPPLVPARETAEFTTLYARAPGFAWRRIEFLPGTEADLRLVLEKGGDLEVRLSGEKRDAGTRLSIYRRGAEDDIPVASEVAGETSRFDLRGFPAGSFTACLEIGRWWQDPVRLLRREFTLAAGERLTLDLEVPAPPDLKLVPLYVVLEIPPDWSPFKRNVRLELLDAPRGGQGFETYLNTPEFEPVPGWRNAWRAGPVEVQAGRHRIFHPASGFFEDVTVEPGGPREVLMKVPPPGEVRVRVVDDLTGDDVWVKDVAFGVIRGEEVGTGYGHRDKLSPGSEVFRLLAARGRIRVWCWGEEDSMWAGSAGQDVTVGTQPVEVVLRMRRTGRIVLRFTEGDSQVPVDWSREEPDALNADGESAVAKLGYWSGKQGLIVHAPGPYRVVFPEMEGYKPIPPVDVSVTAGEEVVVTTRLVPLR